MAERITDRMVKAADAPAAGNRIVYDDDVRGFGLRITAQGAKAFVVNYRIGGRERRITIGSYPDWSVVAAKERAREIKRQVDSGEDPMAERHRERAAPTVADLAVRYLEEHAPRKRERSVIEDRSILKGIILPRLGTMRVELVRRGDISLLHREVSEATPVRANRALSLLTKMFNLAIGWEMRTDNPTKGVEKNHEEHRDRYLMPAELIRLTEALALHRDQVTANAIRLLLLTGARRGEVLGATWSQIDLVGGVWTKPSAATKQKKLHRVPLSAAALVLLVEMRAQSDEALAKALAASGDPARAHAQHGMLFPGRGDNLAQADLKRSWASICKGAELSGLRVHDLRHSYASILASSGMSLPIIGALLGHTQAATTQRYAHLMDDPLRAATERVGVLISGNAKMDGSRG